MHTQWFTVVDKYFLISSQLSFIHLFISSWQHLTYQLYYVNSVSIGSEILCLWFCVGQNTWRRRCRLWIKFTELFLNWQFLKQSCQEERMLEYIIQGIRWLLCACKQIKTTCTIGRYDLFHVISFKLVPPCGWLAYCNSITRNKYHIWHQ